MPGLPRLPASASEPDTRPHPGGEVAVSSRYSTLDMNGKACADEV
jgi:hypothetical protein